MIVTVINNINQKVILHNKNLVLRFNQHSKQSHVHECRAITNILRYFNWSKWWLWKWLWFNLCQSWVEFQWEWCKWFISRKKKHFNSEIWGLDVIINVWWLWLWSTISIRKLFSTTKIWFLDSINIQNNLTFTNVESFQTFLGISIDRNDDYENGCDLIHVNREFESKKMARTFVCFLKMWDLRRTIDSWIKDSENLSFIRHKHLR
jgi:hypothetical protein